MNIKMPAFFSGLKTYQISQLPKDLFAGIIVAIVALPLSIALSIASGVRPEVGLYTGIVGGLFVAFFSGSRVQIGGITAATVMTVNIIVSEYGMVGLGIASIIAGILLILMGLLRLGELLKYIPITITTGFTAGIAIGIFTSQIKEFFGLTIEHMPIKILDKWIVCIQAYKSASLIPIGIALCSLCILLIIPKISRRIPASIVMIVLMTIVVRIFNIPVHTVSGVYGELPSHLPTFLMPAFSIDMISGILVDSCTLAFLVAIVSLLSCVVTDGITGIKHDSNTELIAQGIANIGCGFFGAAPIAGAVARSKSSIDNGGKSQFVGIVHCIVLAFFLLVMMPYIGMIPMPCLSAFLMLIAFQMINWSEIKYTFKFAPKSDAIVLIATILMAVVFDLMVSIVIGFIVSNILFMRRMSEVASVNSWRYIEDEPVEDSSLRTLPPHTEVFEISGPMFFAASEKLLHINPKQDCKYVILRLRSVSAIDATAMHRLEYILEHFKKRNITLILSHLNEQPKQVITKSGFALLMGEEHICEHLEDAICHIEQMEHHS